MTKPDETPRLGVHSLTMSNMAYSHKNSKGQTYFLHSQNVTLRGGRKQVIFYFAKEVKPGALDELPEGRMVVENKKTGLPLLKRIDKK